MNRLFGGALGLALGMATFAGPVLAQETPPIVINADGPNVTDSGAGANSTRTLPRPSSSNDGGTVTLGDIDPGAGTVVIEAEPGPTTTNGRPSEGVSTAPPSGPASAPGPAASGDDGGSDRAVPTPEDQDADNYPDADEPAAGLDPSNPDTDGDGLADGDEVNIYGTEPTVYDTDGDGLGDGEELFWTDTDPLVPDAAASGQSVEPEPRREPAPSTSGSDDAVIDGPLESTVLEEPSVVQSESAPPAGSTSSAGSAASCGDYADWYAAQTAFESSPASLAALDPDGDGIACESMMES